MGDKSCIRENKRYTLSQRVKKYCKPINIFSLYTTAKCLLCHSRHSFFYNNTKYTIEYVQYSDVDVQLLAMDILHDVLN